MVGKLQLKNNRLQSMKPTNYKDRIHRNNEYYNTHSSNLVIRTSKRDYTKWTNLFLEGLNNDKHILDIGCGNGSHLDLFEKQGFKTIGIEPSTKLRDLCIIRGLNVIDGSFEKLDELELPELTGIWCAASLLHVPEEECENVFFSLSKLLPEGGKLFITVRQGEKSSWDKYDSSNNTTKRFIQLYSKEMLVSVANKNNLHVSTMEIEDSYWGRPCKWILIIFEKTL